MVGQAYNNRVDSRDCSVTKAKMGGPEIDIDRLELGQIVDAQIF